MAAAADPNHARYYSLHRQFGLEPDPTPPMAPAAGQPVELVSSIDAGVGGEPPASASRVRTITTNGKTTRTVVRETTADDPT
jgi:hypothetical protein